MNLYPHSLMFNVWPSKPSQPQHDQLPEGMTEPEGGEWPEFFKMPVIMLMLITLLNDGALVSIGYDNVTPSKYPEKWNLKVRVVCGEMNE